MLTIPLLSRLTSYVDIIIGHHQCGFRRNGSTTDRIRQILGKKMGVSWGSTSIIYIF